VLDDKVFLLAWTRRNLYRGFHGAGNYSM
jgi:hypothetical protein